jgi:hypothetical protein
VVSGDENSEFAPQSDLYNGVPGAEHRDHVLHKLCSRAWPPKGTVRLATMLKDVSLGRVPGEQMLLARGGLRNAHFELYLWHSCPG